MKNDSTQLEPPHLSEACRCFVKWLNSRILNDARGDNLHQLTVEPSGRFWLGRLSPEDRVISSSWGDRFERMEPCAIGLRVRPASTPPWRFSATVKACGWYKDASTSSWRKTAIHEETLFVSAYPMDSQSYQCTQFEQAMSAALKGQVQLRLDVISEQGQDGTPELVVYAVNCTPEGPSAPADDCLYQVQLDIQGLDTLPFLLEALPDSFRYDREVAAYGINCSVSRLPKGFRTEDASIVEQGRPVFWSSSDPEPDLTFRTLAHDPLPQLAALVEAHKAWGGQYWSSQYLDQLATDHGWSSEMRAEAVRAAGEFQIESQRLLAGLSLLRDNPRLCRSFQLMNKAIMQSARGRYDRWRPFQLGFILATLEVCGGEGTSSQIADILWFATGGGKTETYLGLLLIAMFNDRLRGKTGGVTAWSRFPLRLLSLQQTQRFADAIAAAELVRRDKGIGGDWFSLGFFVGEGGTPNRIELEPQPGLPDPYDDEMPHRYKILRRCPFCGSDIRMAFDRRFWRLEHRCISDTCPWPEDALPFYIVDEEIFRFLPTVIVGTLDKVALVSMQAAMRGLMGAPLGICSEEGHGYVYAPRSKRPSGCLVPGCRGSARRLPMPGELYSPLVRLQDELHLLRDTLGAIDSHYESLLDDLQAANGPTVPKIVGSSATLTGSGRQCEIVYARDGRIFPLQGPSVRESFWSRHAESLLRRYVALAPRGVTLEFAADRILTTLQQAVRDLAKSPEEVCAAAGVDVSYADGLLSLYGTDVVYGNTIRDLDASTRSLETQVPVGRLITAQLTGQTPFTEVARVLERLEKPEADFSDRIHVVTASAMMSHGVDIDRLNVMVMLGVPLATAEFIQTTARIGRRWPGLVFVLHKMALERDASVYRCFTHFVEQGDRFVDPVPVTRRSLRVLERTLPGLALARILHIHEQRSGGPLTTAPKLRTFVESGGIREEDEVAAVIALLRFDPTVDESACKYIAGWYRDFFRNIRDGDPAARFPAELSPSGQPMRSLRDVEEQAAVHD